MWPTPRTTKYRILVASLTEYHGKWTRATPWCPVEYRVCCGLFMWYAHVVRRRLGSHATAWQLVVRGGGRLLVPRM